MERKKVFEGEGDRCKKRREPGEVGAQWRKLQWDEDTEEQDQCEEVLRAPNSEERERRIRSENSVEGEGVVRVGDVQAEIVTQGRPESQEETQGRSNLDEKATACPQSRGPRQVPHWG
ncbi:hypothetical protein NDU88_004108 [Pleurodeles waltl]|uniref:Uncharacterized protein n=1 Tax=Pleurodeles waltl TaxID=8319 RepID=A0AAV7W8U4_PLEWA|nr:hypothetical protein NDU88_004108 [Pleurodeles waltl]